MAGFNCGVCVFMKKTKASKLYFLLLCHSILSSAFLFSLFFIYDCFLYWQLGNFDLNGDGVFSFNEINSDYYKIENKIISDAGKNVLLLISFFVYFLMDILVLFVFNLVRKFKK